MYYLNSALSHLFVSSSCLFEDACACHGMYHTMMWSSPSLSHYEAIKKNTATMSQSLVKELAFSNVGALCYRV